MMVIQFKASVMKKLTFPELRLKNSDKLEIRKAATAGGKLW